MVSVRASCPKISVSASRLPLKSTERSTVVEPTHVGQLTLKDPNTSACPEEFEAGGARRLAVEQEASSNRHRPHQDPRASCHGYSSRMMTSRHAQRAPQRGNNQTDPGGVDRTDLRGLLTG